ncbi:MAG: DedA family protein [Chloroflexota bacterium]|nr:DedA family protein [Chloroflexota bacterium]
MDTALLGPGLDSLGDWVATLFDDYGYLLTFFGALLENTALMGLFLPGGTIVMVAAAFARAGTLQWPLVVALGWAGMVLGTSADYWLGRTGFRPLARRFIRGTRVARELVRARRLLERYGGWAVLGGHFLGHLRSFIALTAGSARFPFRRYLLFEAVAALVWNGLYCGLAYFLAGHLDTLRKLAERFGLGAAIAAVIALVLWRIGRGRLRHRPGEARP